MREVTEPVRPAGYTPHNRQPIDLSHTSKDEDNSQEWRFVMKNTPGKDLQLRLYNHEEKKTKYNNGSDRRRPTWSAMRSSVPISDIAKRDKESKAALKRSKQYSHVKSKVDTNLELRDFNGNLGKSGDKPQNSYLQNRRSHSAVVWRSDTTANLPTSQRRAVSASVNESSILEPGVSLNSPSRTKSSGFNKINNSPFSALLPSSIDVYKNMSHVKYGTYGTPSSYKNRTDDNKLDSNKTKEKNSSSMDVYKNRPYIYKHRALSAKENNLTANANLNSDKSKEISNTFDLLPSSLSIYRNISNDDNNKNNNTGGILYRTPAIDKLNPETVNKESLGTERVSENPIQYPSSIDIYKTLPRVNGFHQAPPSADTQTMKNSTDLGEEPQKTSNNPPGTMNEYNNLSHANAFYRTLLSDTNKEHNLSKNEEVDKNTAIESHEYKRIKDNILRSSYPWKNNYIENTFFEKQHAERTTQEWKPQVYVNGNKSFSKKPNELPSIKNQAVSNFIKDSSYQSENAGVSTTPGFSINTRKIPSNVVSHLNNDLHKNNHFYSSRRGSFEYYGLNGNTFLDSVRTSPREELKVANIIKKNGQLTSKTGDEDLDKFLANSSNNYNFLYEQRYRQFSGLLESKRTDGFINKYLRDTIEHDPPEYPHDISNEKQSTDHNSSYIPKGSNYPEYMNYPDRNTKQSSSYMIDNYLQESSKYTNRDSNEVSNTRTRLESNDKDYYNSRPTSSIVEASNHIKSWIDNLTLETLQKEAKKSSLSNTYNNELPEVPYRNTLPPITAFTKNNALSMPVSNVEDVPYDSKIKTILKKNKAVRIELENNRYHCYTPEFDKSVQKLSLTY